MHQLFRNAIFQRAPVVFGRQLRPFSLAHAYVLEAFESPYMRGGADPTIEDMALLVWVCSQDAYPFERLADEMLDPRLQKRMAKWGRRVRSQDLAAEADKVRQYLMVAHDQPARYFREGALRKPSMPWPLVIFVRLKQAGFDEATAWNQPLPMSTAIKLTVDWLAGDDSMENDDQRAAINRMKADLSKKQP